MVPNFTLYSQKHVILKKKYKIEKSHEKNRDERAEEDNTISSVGVIEWWCKPDYI